MGTISTIMVILIGTPINNKLNYQQSATITIENNNKEDTVKKIRNKGFELEMEQMNSKTTIYKAYYNTNKDKTEGKLKEVFRISGVKSIKKN